MKNINVFGKRSVSEVINVLLRISWVLVWATPVIFLIWFIVLWTEAGYDDTIKYLAYQVSNKFNTFEIFFFLGVQWVLFVSTIWGLKKIFTNFLENKIFVPANTTAIRVIALAKLVSSTYITFSYQGIFFAVVIFILAEIFKVGDDLKKDSEAIV